MDDQFSLNRSLTLRQSRGDCAYSSFKARDPVFFQRDDTEKDGGKSYNDGDEMILRRKMTDPRMRNLEKRLPQQSTDESSAAGKTGSGVSPLKHTIRTRLLAEPFKREVLYKKKTS